jgi:hypothetical protein
VTATFVKFDTALQAARADSKLAKATRFITGHAGNWKVTKTLPENEIAFMEVSAHLEASHFVDNEGHQRTQGVLWVEIK